MIRIEAVYALPDYQYEEELTLPDGACVNDALEALASCPGFSELDLAAVPVGIFGEPVARRRSLAEGDRLEIYRPLKMDPLAARRQRAEQQARSAPRALRQSVDPAWRTPKGRSRQ